VWSRSGNLGVKVEYIEWNWSGNRVEIELKWKEMKGKEVA